MGLYIKGVRVVGRPGQRRGVRLNPNKRRPRRNRRTVPEKLHLPVHERLRPGDLTYRQIS